MNRLLNESLLIAEGKTLLLPTVDHIRAMADELKKFEHYEPEPLKEEEYA